MVWYGRVWDDKAGDWAHELDDVQPSARRRDEAPLRAVQRPPEPFVLYGVTIECKESVEHRMSGNSGWAWCVACGLRYRRLHTSAGGVVVGTGALIEAVGEAKGDIAVGQRLGVGG